MSTEMLLHEAPAPAWADPMLDAHDEDEDEEGYDFYDDDDEDDEEDDFFDDDDDELESDDDFDDEDD